MISTIPTQSPIQSAADLAALPHVLLVVDQFGKTLGGGERIALRLAALLPQYGYRASILTFFISPDTAALSSPPCPIHLLPITRTYDLTALRAAFELGRLLDTEQVQIVETFFESSDLWAGLVTKALSSAKLIWSRRDMGILRTRKHEIAYRLMAGAPDAVFAVSAEVRQHVIEVDGVDADRVFTIYNGLNLSDWSASSPRPLRTDGDFHITTIGNIRRVKGHDIFVWAAARVVAQFPEASFSIGGEVLDPEYFIELQSLVNQLQLSARFHFLGGVTDTRRHLSEADVFVLPSRSEGFSNSIVEAMAASLPVVATRVGGNAEAIEDGVSGFIVPADDPEALADAIIRLLSDPAAAQAMGAAGHAFAAKNFTTEAMLQRVTACYDRLIGSHS